VSAGEAGVNEFGTVSAGAAVGTTDDSLLEDGGRLWTPAFFGGLAAVLVGGIVARYLAVHVPEWTAESSWSGIGAAIEFPIYAIALGLLLNIGLNAAGVRDKLAGGYRTEFFIKTGLVILGAGIVLSVIISAAGPAILQAVLLISAVFAFTWWLGGVVGLDQKLRALLATAVSICGVSAAIAAAGAVQAKREQLAYAASLVIVFALPSIFLFPWIAGLLGLSPAVTGAWLGGNIDTTAAVTAAGSIAGEQPLAIATVVKLTQNALIGVVAVALTAWFAFKVEAADADGSKPRLVELWHRFPKFVLGFVAASIAATLVLKGASPADADQINSSVKTLRDYFLILAFVSIGLEFKVKALRDAGWKPVGVFGAATVFNALVALLLASVLFKGFVV
jgi:uncharacterized membrane protein YadS